MERRPARPRAARRRAAGWGRPWPKRDGLSRGTQRNGSEERSTLGRGPHAGVHGRTSAPWTRLCLIWRPPGSAHHPASAAWSWGEGRLGEAGESTVQLGGVGIRGHLVGWGLQPLFPVPRGPSRMPWDHVRLPRHEGLHVDTQRTGQGRLHRGFCSPVWGNGKPVFDSDLLRGFAEGRSRWPMALSHCHGFSPAAFFATKKRRKKKKSRNPNTLTAKKNKQEGDCRVGGMVGQDRTADVLLVSTE